LKQKGKEDADEYEAICSIIIEEGEKLYTSNFKIKKNSKFSERICKRIFISPPKNNFIQKK
jgi:hypothetical protein